MKKNIFLKALLFTSVLSMLVAAPAFAAQEVESNNSMSTANVANYGSDYSVGYLSASDSDWWKLTATRTGSHTIYFTNHSQPYALKIFSSTGTLLYSGSSSTININLTSGETYYFNAYATASTANFSYPYFIYVS